jgi:hypothetical protein
MGADIRWRESVMSDSEFDTRVNRGSHGMSSVGPVERTYEEVDDASADNE